VSAPLAFGCECGAVAGAVSAEGIAQGRRYVCHCRDCQAFAHYTGHADTVLDRHAGTDILQMPAGAVSLARGRDSLAAVHLTDRPLLRWSCRTCRTPLANSLASPKWAFYSMILTSPDARAIGNASAKHVFPESGCNVPDDVEQASMMAMALPIMKWLASARWTGSWRQHPLFDPKTGAPLAKPVGLSKEERAALDQQVDAFCGHAGG
jgi:hypothetical protein